MKYRKRHLLAALLSAFTLFSGQALAMSVDNLMQVVAKDSATGKTISWQSDSDRSDYSVEYRHKDQDDVQLAYVTEGKRPPIYDADNPAPYTYGAYMQKLTPATEYEYRIVNADGATDWITFSTTKEDLNKYKVLVFGDSQSTDYSSGGRRRRSPGSRTMMRLSSSTWATLPTTDRPTSSGGTGLKMPMS